MDTLTFFVVAIWMLLYATKLQKVHNKYFCAAALVARVLSTWLLSIEVRGDNSTPKAKWLLIINAALFNSVVRAFLTMPATLAFSKCTPHSVEALMMGLLGSIIKMSTEVISRMLGLLTLKDKNVTLHDFSGMSIGLIDNVIYQLLGLLALGFIFSRNEFMDLQVLLAKVSTMTRAEIKNLNLEMAEKRNRKRRLSFKRRASMRERLSSNLEIVNHEDAGLRRMYEIKQRQQVLMEIYGDDDTDLYGPDLFKEPENDDQQFRSTTVN